MRSAAGILKQVLPCRWQSVQAGLDPVAPAGAALHGLVMGQTQFVRRSSAKGGDEEVRLSAVLFGLQ